MFKVKELRDRTTIGWSAKNIDKVSIDDFPFAISKFAPPWAFGEVVVLVGGQDYVDAQQNAEYIFRALKVYEVILKHLQLKEEIESFIKSSNK
jgi:hypothetical protein